MAFPTRAATATSLQSSLVTSHVISLPTGIVSGDLLIPVIGFGAGGKGPSWPAGYTVFANPGGNDVANAARRVADGTEGSTITVTTTSGEQSVHISQRITGAATAGTILEDAEATGGGDNPNPPNLAPSGGSKEYLWIELCGGIGTFANFRLGASPSTNYTGAVRNPSNNIDMGTAYRQLEASSENPGTWSSTGAGFGGWAAVTIAVWPAAAGGGISRPVALYHQRHHNLAA